MAVLGALSFFSPPVIALLCFARAGSLFFVCLRPCALFLSLTVCVYCCAPYSKYPLERNLFWNLYFWTSFRVVCLWFLDWLLFISPPAPCLIAINCFLLNKSLHNLCSTRWCMIQSVKPSAPSATPRQICHSTSGLSTSFPGQLDFPHILGRPHPSGRTIIRACIRSFPGIPKVTLPQYLVCQENINYVVLCNGVNKIYATPALKVAARPLAPHFSCNKWSRTELNWIHTGLRHSVWHKHKQCAHSFLFQKFTQLLQLIF